MIWDTIVEKSSPIIRWRPALSIIQPELLKTRIRVDKNIFYLSAATTNVEPSTDNMADPIVGDYEPLNHQYTLTDSTNNSSRMSQPWDANIGAAEADDNVERVKLSRLRRRLRDRGLKFEFL